jgi:nicotinate phosphoribosyltransferase
MKKRSILDNDLYKFTMMWAVMAHFPDVKVRYEFVLRDGTRNMTGVAEELRKRIDTFDTIRLTQEERDAFQEKCPYLPNLFFDFLSGYKFNPSEVSIMEEDDSLKIIIQGYWYRTILWEVILMSEISEIFFKLNKENLNITQTIGTINDLDQKKFAYFKNHNMLVADFGTRRRYSYDNHNRVINIAKNYGGNKFIGTSNVELAIKYDTKAIGTFAHEWISGIAAIYGYAHANKIAMELWVKTYHGNLGIALTDTFGLDSFLNDFDMKYAKLFDGVRHDSGDPFIFGDKIIAHYESLGIDPKTKTIVFSNGLDLPSAESIATYFKGRINYSFGIGTNLTNDLPGIKALNMVIKLFKINNKHVIKLSDDVEKHTGDAKTINIVKSMINYKGLK